jgi:hypothetical protein
MKEKKGSGFYYCHRCGSFIFGRFSLDTELGEIFLNVGAQRKFRPMENWVLTNFWII